MTTTLFEDYSDSDCRVCMEECLRYHCFTLAFIKGYLGRRTHIHTPVTRPSRTLHEIGLLYGTNVKRTMEEYRI